MEMEAIHIEENYILLCFGSDADMIKCAKYIGTSTNNSNTYPAINCLGEYAWVGSDLFLSYQSLWPCAFSRHQAADKAHFHMAIR